MSDDINKSDLRMPEAHPLPGNPYPEHSYLHETYKLAHLDVPCTQAEFGEFVGISQQAVSQLVQRGVLHPKGTGLAWLRAYTSHLKDEIVRRLGN